MKDLSQYHYSELYDMLNHINPFKHPDRIEAVEHEITLRKQNGEVPDRLIPKISFRFSDLPDFFLVLFSINQLSGAFSSIILVIVMTLTIQGSLSSNDYLFLLTFSLASIALFYGAIQLIRRRISGVSISFFAYILNTLSFLIFGLNTIAQAFDLNLDAISPITFIPFTNLIILILIFYFINRSSPRNLRDVLHDSINFRDEKIFVDHT